MPIWIYALLGAMGFCSTIVLILGVILAWVRHEEELRRRKDVEVAIRQHRQMARNAGMN